MMIIIIFHFRIMYTAVCPFSFHFIWFSFFDIDSFRLFLKNSDTFSRSIIVYVQFVCSFYDIQRRCFPKCCTRGHQDSAYCGRPIEAKVIITHDVEIDWHQECKRLWYSMYKITTTTSTTTTTTTTTTEFVY